MKAILKKIFSNPTALISIIAGVMTVTIYILMGFWSMWISGSWIQDVLNPPPYPIYVDRRELLPSAFDGFMLIFIAFIFFVSLYEIIAGIMSYKYENIRYSLKYASLIKFSAFLFVVLCALISKEWLDSNIEDATFEFGLYFKFNVAVIPFAVIGVLIAPIANFIFTKKTEKNMDGTVNLKRAKLFYRCFLIISIVLSVLYYFLPACLNLLFVDFNIS